VKRKTKRIKSKRSNVIDISFGDEVVSPRGIESFNL
jgi:hypothetical protein